MRHRLPVANNPDHIELADADAERLESLIIMGC
jgi:hypothetical protein